LYLPGEPVELEVNFHSARTPAAPLTIQVTSFAEGSPAEKRAVTISLPVSTPPLLPAPPSKGLQIIAARLIEGSTLRAIDHSPFWIRDEEFLHGGPRLGVNSDFLTVDRKPLAVVGTTYMSSEVQRLYFDHPNVYVWNRDLAQI